METQIWPVAAKNNEVGTGIRVTSSFVLGKVSLREMKEVRGWTGRLTDSMEAEIQG